MDDLQYVGFWARFWATMLDILLLMMIIYPLLYMVYGEAFIEKSTDFSLANTLINYILPFIAILILWHYKSATPGKMFIKAKIVDAKTLEKPTTKQFIIRNLGYYLSVLPLGFGYFWAGWDAKKQAWHDKLAGTVVVQPKQEKKKKSIGSYIAIGFGVFAMVVFTVLVILGIRLQSGMMPDGDLYNTKRLPSSVKVELVEKNVLYTGETLVFYQPESAFTFTDEGTMFTQKSIRYFKTDEHGEVIIWDFPLDKIGNLTLESEVLVLDINIVTMILTNDSGEENFSIGLSLKSSKVEAFKKELMELWKNARKN